MRYWVVLVLTGLLMAQCGKDNSKPPVRATIVGKSDFNNAYLALLHDSSGTAYSFNCSKPEGYLPPYNCKNAIYIRNLPSGLATAGQKITFATWKDYGQPLMLSSINHAHELDITGAKAAY